MVKAERDGQAFPGSDGHSNQEWEQLALAAKYLSDLRDECAKFTPEQLPDYVKSEAQSADESKSLWELALSRRKKYLQSKRQSSQADRAKIIRNELSDFTVLHARSIERQALVEKLERLADSSNSSRIRDLINEVINGSKQPDKKLT